MTRANPVLPTTIRTTDSQTGGELPIPIDFQTRVHRAAEILDQEVANLTAKFALSALWQFVRRSDGTYGVEMVVVSGESGSTRAIGGPYSPEQLADDDTTRRALRPTLVGLGHMLSGLVRLRLDLIRKQIQKDLDLLATTVGE